VAAQTAIFEETFATSLGAMIAMKDSALPPNE